ncbi:MAG: hypothetical protein GY797_35660 [Deltaproteobacteria bacterium]|nr:hypothetical protein [Deltaproteobacteria bacterium]
MQNVKTVPSNHLIGFPGFGLMMYGKSAKDREMKNLIGQSFAILLIG